jgi:hypothetical protein
LPGQRLTAASGCRVSLCWHSRFFKEQAHFIAQIGQMADKHQLCLPYIKVALIAPTQLAASSLNKSVLP